MKKLLLTIIFFLITMPVSNSLAVSTTNLDISAGTITLNGSENTTYLIRQSDTSTATDNTITISSGNVEITIFNLNMSATKSPIVVSSGASLILNIMGENTLSAGNYYSAINVNKNATLTIRGQGTLTAQGGKEAAAIGGNRTSTTLPNTTGKIIIDSGTITANGGDGGAGIGGGRKGNSGEIIINGGDITAKGGKDGGPYIPGGAGIGGGEGGTCNIIINGGNVSANAGYGYDGDGAGIGSGYCAVGGNIQINDGVIVASSFDGAGIGGGANESKYNGTDKGNGGTIIINGGIITATSRHDGAGIGGGTYGSGGNISINGGNVTATSENNYGAGIGGGREADGGIITIKNATVIAKARYQYGGAGIGGGEGGTGGQVYIENSDVTVRGGFSGIGGGYNDNSYGCDSIVIKNSTMNVTNYVTASWGGAKYMEKIFVEAPVTKEYVASKGGTIELSVLVTSASGVTYQWQELGNDSTWTDIDGQNKNNAKITMNNEKDGFSYRCKITNGWGNVVYSDVFKCFVLSFSKQPQTATANAGEMILFEAESSFPDVSYQWEKSIDGGLTYSKMDDEIYNTLLFVSELECDETLYRCVITAKNGDYLESDCAKLNVTTDKITTNTKISSNGVFTVKGYNLTNGNTVILALYNGEQFVEMQKAVYTGEAIPFTTTKSYTNAKVFVWENFETLVPICEAEIVK